MTDFSDLPTLEGLSKMEEDDFWHKNSSCCNEPIVKGPTPKALISLEELAEFGEYSMKYGFICSYCGEKVRVRWYNPDLHK